MAGQRKDTDKKKSKIDAVHFTPGLQSRNITIGKTGNTNAFSSRL